MKLRLCKALILLFLIALPNFSVAQETSGSDRCKCNYSCWPAMEKPGNLTEKDILCFIKSLGLECESNVEFSEFSNELLFKILEVNSELFISVLEKQKSPDIAYIFIMLENPVSDTIELSTIIKNVKSTTNKSVTKEKIINALQKALKKYSGT